MKTKFKLLIAFATATGSIHAQTNGLLKSPVWLTTGNYGTNPTNNFLGTKDAEDIVFRTNNIERLRITKNGRIGIGISNPQDQKEY